jgi:NAD(P)-dependent dehydrogenase (short-subunit alcohol dehydrogenase family)
VTTGRFGEPDEITAMICWFASDEMSFSTGAVFDMSGSRATY